MGDGGGQHDTGPSFDRRDVLELIVILPARDQDVLRNYYGLDGSSRPEVAIAASPEIGGGKNYRVCRDAVARLREMMRIAP